MSSEKTLVTLQVTVNTESFAIAYGFDPEGDLRGDLAEMAGYDCTVGPWMGDQRGNQIADVGGTARWERSKPHEAQLMLPGFTVAHVHLTVSVDPEKFTARYGLAPQDVVGQFIAAELLQRSVIKDNEGTVIPLPVGGGR